MLKTILKSLGQAVAVSLIVFGMTTGAVAVEFIVPLAIESGGVETNLSFGISPTAVDGYDYGLDGVISPSLISGESLDAYFYHPEWDVVVDGETVSAFHSDIRSSMPQEFYLEVDSLALQVTVRWLWDDLPEQGEFWLYDHAEAIWIDMRAQMSYSFTPASGFYGLTVSVSEGDVVPPGASIGVSHEGRGETSLYLEWPQGSEEDIAGYKVHFGKESGSYYRTRDLRLVYNYTLKKLKKGQTYYIALTAYDTSGNESGYSTEIAYMVPEEVYRVYGILSLGKTTPILRKKVDDALAGIVISLRGNHGRSFSTQTAGNGTFEITGVPKGKYKLLVNETESVSRAMKSVRVVDADVYVDIKAKRRKKR